MESVIRHFSLAHVTKCSQFSPLPVVLLFRGPLKHLGGNAGVLCDHNFLGSGKYRPEVVGFGCGGQTSRQQQWLGPLCCCCKQQTLWTRCNAEPDVNPPGYPPSREHPFTCPCPATHTTLLLLYAERHLVNITQTRKVISYVPPSGDSWCKSTVWI